VDVSTIILSILFPSYNLGFLFGPVVKKGMQFPFVVTSSQDFVT